MKPIRIHERDNVAVCPQEIRAGEEITVGSITLVAKTSVPAGEN